MIFPSRIKAMRKKLVKSISLTMTGLLLLSNLVGTGAGNVLAAEASASKNEAIQFNDVKDSYASKEIADLAGAGIISGYGAGMFEPRRQMTRAELAKVLTISLKLKELPEVADVFTDVPKDSWYKGYVGALVREGIVQGTSELAFSPDVPVTREELVVLLIRSLGLSRIATKLELGSDLTDMDQVSVWAKHEVSLAYRIGLIGGIDNGNGTVRFDPKANAERQALAKLAYGVVHQKDDLIEKAKSFDTAPAAPEPKPEATPSPPVFGGGGGGGGPLAPVPTPANPQSILSGTGVYNGDVRITNGGNYGPSMGEITVNGTLTVDPGSAGTVTLKNVRANNLFVLSGAADSIHLVGVKVTGNMKVAANQQNNMVRIVIEGNTVIGSTQVNSAVILDQSVGTGTLGTVTIQTTAVGNFIEFRGGANAFQVSDGSAPVRLALSHGASLTGELFANTTVDSSAGTFFKAILGKMLQLQTTGHGELNLSVPSAAAGTLINLSGDAKTVLQLNANITLNADADASSNLELEADSNLGGAIEASDELKAALRNSAVQKAIAAIQAIGDFDKYSTDVEGKIIYARRLVNAAFIVGAQEQVIINHSTLTNAERLIIALKVGETVTRPPAIYGHLYANGGIISGFVEPLSNVMIYRGDGSELNKLNIAGDRFSLNFQGENVFHENEQITIVAQMPGQPPSPVQIMKVEGNQGQTQTPVLKQPITSSSKKLYVEAEPYSQITIKVEGSQTEVMGSLWGPSGYVDISSLHLNAGSTLQVTARTFGKIISQVSSMKVLEPAGKTNKPLWNTAAAKQIYANGGLLPLRVEPYSALTLKKSDGTILASLNTDLYGYVSGSGIAFNFDSSNGFVEIMLKGPFEVSDYIEAISEVEGHLPSDSLQIPVQPISGTTEAPAGRMTQGIPGWLIRGTAEPNALLTVTRVSNGEVVGGTDYAKSSGDYGVYLNPEISVQPGERFRVTAEAPGKAVSLPVVVTAAEEDLELSNKPVITGNIYTNGAVLKVKAEPNAEVRAIYNGNTIAGSFTDMNGDGILRIYYLGGKAEDTVTITSKAYGKQQSVPVAKAIMPITDEISQLTCETCVVKDHADGMLRGTADPYATLLITDDYGVVKIEQTMYQSSDGSFELRVWPQSLNYRTGSQLWLIARSPGKLLSQRIPLTIAAASTTAKPTFSELKIYENGGYIGGTTEADAWVYVKDRFGRQLGSTSVYDAGNVKFKFKLDRRDLPLTAGDTVYITAQAPGKKESEPVIAEVLPIYGTTSVPTLKNDVYDYVPYILEGTADPYTFVDFFYKGVKVAGAISDGTGNYAVTFGSDVQFAGGEFLQMKGETIGKAPSERVQLPILAAPKTETPVVTGTVYGNGISLTVTMQTNGYYFVNIKTVDNTNIYQSEFFLKDTISFLRLDPPYISGKLTVTVQKAGMKKSDPVYVDVLPLQGKTEQPSATGTVKSSMDSNI